MKTGRPRKTKPDPMLVYCNDREAGKRVARFRRIMLADGFDFLQAEGAWWVFATHSFHSTDPKRGAINEQGKPYSEADWAEAFRCSSAQAAQILANLAKSRAAKFSKRNGWQFVNCGKGATSKDFERFFLESKSRVLESKRIQKNPRARCSCSFTKKGDTQGGMNANDHLYGLAKSVWLSVPSLVSDFVANYPPDWVEAALVIAKRKRLAVGQVRAILQRYQRDGGPDAKELAPVRERQQREARERQYEQERAEREAPAEDGSAVDDLPDAQWQAHRQAVLDGNAVVKESVRKWEKAGRDARQHRMLRLLVAERIKEEPDGR